MYRNDQKLQLSWLLISNDTYNQIVHKQYSHLCFPIDPSCPTTKPQDPRSLNPSTIIILLHLQLSCHLLHRRSCTPLS